MFLLVLDSGLLPRTTPIVRMYPIIHIAERLLLVLTPSSAVPYRPTDCLCQAVWLVHQEIITLEFCCIRTPLAIWEWMTQVQKGMFTDAIRDPSVIVRVVAKSVPVLEWKILQTPLNPNQRSSNRHTTQLLMLTTRCLYGSVAVCIGRRRNNNGQTTDVRWLLLQLEQDLTISDISERSVSNQLINYWFLRWSDILF